MEVNRSLLEQTKNKFLIFLEDAGGDKKIINGYKEMSLDELIEGFINRFNLLGTNVASLSIAQYLGISILDFGSLMQISQYLNDINQLLNIQ